MHPCKKNDYAYVISTKNLVNPNGSCLTFFSLLIFGKKMQVLKNLSGLPSECQAVCEQLDPDQAHQNVVPDMGPNCSQSLSADNKSGERLKECYSCVCRCDKHHV